MFAIFKYEYDSSQLLYLVETEQQAIIEIANLTDTLKKARNIYEQFEFIETFEFDEINAELDYEYLFPLSTPSVWDEGLKIWHEILWDELEYLEEYEKTLQEKFLKSIFKYHLTCDMWKYIDTIDIVSDSLQFGYQETYIKCT
jgi:hypothetical protein